MPRRTLVRIAVLAILGIVGAACGGSEAGPMLVLATPMEGTLVDKDLRPVPNVRVERTWKWAWTGRQGSDVYTTDVQGHFEFPMVKGFSLTASVLPHQPQIDLSITANGPNGPVLLYEVTKSDYSDRTKSGKPLNIVCRIDLEPALTLGKYWGTVIEVK